MPTQRSRDPAPGKPEQADDVSGRVDTGPGPGAAGTASSLAGKPDLAEAVAAAQRGDEQGFRALYRDMQPRLLRYLRAMVGDDAEDVASETWLHVARDLPAFSGDSDGFRGWTATIARHRATDHQRRHRRRPASSATRLEDLGDLPGGDDTAASALDAVSTDAAIAMIADLPRDQAEAVLLRVVMGLDAERAGQVLGKRAGAVRTAAYRGLRRLAARLEKAQAVAGPAGSHAPGFDGTGYDGTGYDGTGYDGTGPAAPVQETAGPQAPGRGAPAVRSSGPQPPGRRRPARASADRDTACDQGEREAAGRAAPIV